MKTPARVSYALLIGVLVVSALIGITAGCASPAQATPTPTKTPRPAAEAPATVAPPAVVVEPTQAPTEAPSATPEPATATPEPTATPAPTEAPPAASGPSAAPPTHEPGVSIFTGLRPADPAVLARRPLAFKVDNDPAVVPQSGLGKADIVVETRKEGCLTRFTAIYQSQDASKIGSIRSARLVDVELPVIFDAILSYSGAVGPVQVKLNESDLGREFLVQGSGALYRDPNIAVPFNLFGDTRGAWQAATQKGWNRAPNPAAGWGFSEAAPAGGALASGVSFTYSKIYPHLKVGWNYGAASGRWRRTIGGNPAIDKADGQQLTAADVIILAANHVQTLIAEQGATLTQGPCSNASIEIQLWGEGPAKILRDGKVYEGKWVRPDRHAPFRFLDAQGRDILLKPGNSWWQVVPLDLAVTVTP